MAFLLSTLALILAVQLVQGLHYPQYFQFYNYSDCMGPPMDFFETTVNITAIPGLSSAKSMSDRGVWKMLPVSGGFIVGSYSHLSRGCSNDVAKYPLDSVIRVPAADMDESVLELYSAKYFNGTKQSVDKAEDQFDQAFSVESWAFTGVEGFTLYDGANFTGNSACLQVDSLTKSYGWGLTSASIVTDLTVNSVKVGCDPEAVNIITGDVVDEYESMIYESTDGMDVKRYKRK